MTDISPFQRLRARVLLPAMMLMSVAAMVVVDMVVDGGNASTPLGAMLAVYAAMVVVLLAGARRTGLSWRRLFGDGGRDAGWPLIVVALPLAVMSYGGFWLLWVPVSYFAPDLVRSYALEGMPDLLSGNDPVQLALDVLVIVVIAPVVEEVLFRGVLLHRWAYRWGTAAGVVLSSVVFAVLHVELVGHFIFAVAMAALYVRTQSLWIPIGAHALNNALAVALSIPSILKGEQDQMPTLEEFRGEWQTGALALVIAIMILTVAWRELGPRPPWRLPYAMPPAPHPSVEHPEPQDLPGTPIA